MSKWLVVTVLALVVLTSAMGLKTVVSAHNTPGPMPPTPWFAMNTPGPMPPTRGWLTRPDRCRQRPGTLQGQCRQHPGNSGIGDSG